MKGPQQLIGSYLSGTLQPEEAEALRAWLAADPENRKTFVIETYINRGIFEILLSDRMRAEKSEPDHDRTLPDDGTASPLDPIGIDDSEVLTPTSSAHDDSAIHDILQHTESPEERVRIIERYAKKQLDAFLADHRQTARRPARIPIQKPLVSWDIRTWALKLDRLFSISLRGVVASAAMLAVSLALIVVYQYVASKRVVAVIGDSVHAEWLEEPTQPQLRRGELVLKTGMARLTFMKGAEVLLQAPCQVDLRSSQRFFLTEGNVTAIVPPAAKGFTINTDHSTIVDYGTEFGVAVDRASQAEVHVFKGEVGLRGASKKTLQKNQAAIVNEQGDVGLDQITNRFPVFVRSIPDANQLGIPGKRIDLADIVSGGNGFGSVVRTNVTDRIQASLNPLSGLWNDPRRPLTALYLFDGSQARFGGPGFDALDGTWSHRNSSDYWDGTAPGTGTPGGIGVFQEAETTFIRFQDTGNPSVYIMSDPNNRKLYAGHLLDFGLDGVTLEFRARLATTGVLDKLYPDEKGVIQTWPSEGVGGIITHGGKGMFTIAESYRGPISFSLAKRRELAALPGFEDVPSDALVMNNLVGRSPSDHVDSNDTTPDIRSRNWLPLADASQWNTFRIHISAGGVGTHRVRVSVNGGPAQDFAVTVGTGREGGDLQGQSYIAMGSPPTNSSCAFDVDYLSVYSWLSELSTWSRKSYENTPDTFRHPVEGFETYESVGNSPYIDGVFIPDGERGRCIVTSLGHIFDTCPDTDGTFTGNITSALFTQTTDATLGMELSPPLEHRGIAMNANCGITFDLQQMLHRMPHTQINTFTTRVGVPSQIATDIAEADLWVLVDGQVRFSQIRVSAGQWFDVEVPLNDTDRFLTLMVTDGGRTRKGYRFSQDDTCFFTEPVLLLRSEH